VGENGWGSGPLSLGRVAWVRASNVLPETGPLRMHAPPRSGLAAFAFMSAPSFPRGQGLGETERELCRR